MYEQHKEDIVRYCQGSGWTRIETRRKLHNLYRFLSTQTAGEIDALQVEGEMITALAVSIVDMLCNALAMEEDDKELYTYGFFILLSHLFYLAIAVLLGVLLGILTENLLFYIFFMLLRNYAGGFHAKSERVCTLLTILACLSVLCCTDWKKRWAVCSSLLFCASGTRRPHIVYQSESGGVPLKTREIMLICHYAKEEISIAQIIQTSFDIFLRKELQNVTKTLCSNV